MNIENKDEFEKKLEARGYNHNANICANCKFSHIKLQYDDGPTYYCTFGEKEFPHETPPVEQLGKTARYCKESFDEQLRQLDFIIDTCDNEKKIKETRIRKNKILEKYDKDIYNDVIWDWELDSIEVSAYGTCDEFRSKKE
jgi:hypothetical protein